MKLPLEVDFGAWLRGGALARFLTYVPRSHCTFGFCLLSAVWPLLGKSFTLPEVPCRKSRSGVQQAPPVTQHSWEVFRAKQEGVCRSAVQPPGGGKHWCQHVIIPATQAHRATRSCLLGQVVQGLVWRVHASCLGHELQCLPG